MQQASAPSPIAQLLGAHDARVQQAGWVANAKTNTSGITTKAIPVPTLATSAALTFATADQAVRAWQRAEDRHADRRGTDARRTRQRFARYVQQQWLPQHEMQARTARPTPTTSNATSCRCSRRRGSTRSNPPTSAHGSPT